MPLSCHFLVTLSSILRPLTLHTKHILCSSASWTVRTHLCWHLPAHLPALPSTTTTTARYHLTCCTTTHHTLTGLHRRGARWRRGTSKTRHAGLPPAHLPYSYLRQRTGRRRRACLTRAACCTAPAPAATPHAATLCHCCHRLSVRLPTRRVPSLHRDYCLPANVCL